MIVGTGVDIIEHARWEQELAQAPWEPGHGVFTDSEIRACNSARRPAAQFAACFAAKEALLKALAIEVSDVGYFREIEVKKDGEGRHAISVNARLRKEAEQLGVSRVWLSIASTRRGSAALVVLES